MTDERYPRMSPATGSGTLPSNAGPKRPRSRIGETAPSSQASGSDPPTAADSEDAGVVYGPELERSDRRDVIWMTEAFWDLGRMSLVTAVPASEVGA